jgi:AcrR family transcriptional regulator
MPRGAAGHELLGTTVRPCYSVRPGCPSSPAWPYWSRPPHSTWSASACATLATTVSMWHDGAIMLKAAPRQPLRERQAEQVRAAILDALVARLEREAPEDVPIDELASDAGVSRRTLYRYFPSKDALLAAAEERLVARLRLPTEFASADQISAAFRETSYQLEAYPTLARALRQTTASRLRPPLRARRIEALARVLEPLTRDLDAPEAQRIVAVIAYLCSANAWVMIGDESGLAGEEIRAAVSWAIETLLVDVRRRGRVTKKRRSGGKAAPA